ncbi:MAG: DUF2062 domain-containing protein [Desulfotignum sp.]|nr:DUF2062 domain-containing protein [Desulfotignum sp.]
MVHPPRILIVIPVFNHGKTILRVIWSCKKFHRDILVVDDGSTDLPKDFPTIVGTELISHPVNRGKGAAIMSAARYAREKGFTHMVTMDADLQHSARDIPKFKAIIEAHPEALVIGKRDFANSLAPKSSRFGRKFSNFWFRVQTGMSAGDAQSGFRAYPLFVIDKLTLSRSRYDFEIEVLVKAAWAGVSIKIIDIDVHYHPPGKRVSHFKVFMDNLRLTRLNTRLTFRSFLPWPHKQITDIQAPTPIKFSILHPMKSIRRFLANEISPFEIAMSGAVGVFLGTLPIVGMHTLTILLVTGFFRLNKIVAIGTSQFCMPPLVPALCIEAGYFMTHGGRFLTEISLETLGHQCLDRFLEWCLGSLVVAPTLGLLIFIAIYLMATAAAMVPEKE